MHLDLANAELPLHKTGRLSSITHSAPADKLWRLTHHKRWFYTSFATEDLFFAGSIVSLGYMAKAFVYLADRAQGMVFHHSSLWPTARVGTAEARFAMPGFRASLTRHDGQTLFTARCKGMHAQLGFQERSAPFVAATMLAATHVTEKTLGMDAAGSINGRNVRGTGGVDYTDGFVARHTLWKWANFSSPSVSLNLTQGFVGGTECFAVVNDTHVKLGDAHIDKPSDPMHPWKVTTDCGKVDLIFTPFAMHADSTNLRVIAANFNQPIGVFTGRVHGQTVSAIGVCENQDVLW